MQMTIKFNQMLFGKVVLSWLLSAHHLIVSSNIKIEQENYQRSKATRSFLGLLQILNFYEFFCFLYYVSYTILTRIQLFLPP